MILGGGVMAEPAVVLNVQLPVINPSVFANIDTDAFIYSGIRFGSDGLIYRATVAGAWQSTGNSWLLDGSAALYWLRRTIDGDALNLDDGTLEQMNTDIDFNVKASFGSSTKLTNIEFAIATDSGGVTEVVQRTYVLAADKI